MSKKPKLLSNLRLERFVHGGQVISSAPDGRKVFVWGGLPGELVNVQVTKKRKSYLEAIVTEVIEPSDDRIEPEEPLSYLSTSPWQILSVAAEKTAKQQILEEAFTREGVDNIAFAPFVDDDRQFGYRNKMELGFWGDDDGLHLAHYVRGTHGKQKVQGSALAMDCINQSAQALLKELNRLEVWGGKLKTVVLRASQSSETVAALFVKEELDFSDFKLPEGLKGLDVYYSNPQSPASVPTSKLYSFGDIKLHDTISGINITYDVMSFFQVNVPVLEVVLESIQKLLKPGRIVDMYSGVGTIGLAVGASVLVESDEQNIAMAKLNAQGSDTKVIHAASETALDTIESNDIIIVDPPRAGLHKNVIAHLVEVRPLQIVYLSCNPSTQARDIKILEEYYNISYAQGYNFFPRTPHIESLVVLELR